MPGHGAPTQAAGCCRGCWGAGEGLRVDRTRIPPPGEWPCLSFEVRPGPACFYSRLGSRSPVPTPGLPSPDSSGHGPPPPDSTALGVSHVCTSGHSLASHARQLHPVRRCFSNGLLDAISPASPPLPWRVAALSASLLPHPGARAGCPWARVDQNRAVNLKATAEVSQPRKWREQEVPSSLEAACPSFSQPAGRAGLGGGVLDAWHPEPAAELTVAYSASMRRTAAPCGPATSSARVPKPFHTPLQ